MALTRGACSRNLRGVDQMGGTPSDATVVAVGGGGENVVVATLDGARSAFARRAWLEARAAFADLEALPGEDLERYAEAAYWSGDPEEAIAGYERAYREFRDASDEVGAARSALKLSTLHGRRRETSVAAAWLRRAERLLEGKPECAEHGRLELRAANRVHARGDPGAALVHAERAAEIGRRHGDRDLEALAVHLVGWLRVLAGDLEEGWALMDEATAAAVGGELRADATAVVYCNTVSACRDLGEVGRAGEWTERARAWCERQSIGGFPGVCRVHRAEVMRLRCQWELAESELRQACDELRGFNAIALAEAFVELGEIRRRLGDLGGAEAAFEQARELGNDAQPGLALLLLARDKPAVAARSLERTLEDEALDPLARARLLPAQAQIALAAGDAETARRAADELEQTAVRYRSPALQAAASYARAAACLCDDDGEGAAKAARRASRLWTEIDAPYDAAQARLLLARAYGLGGDDDAAEAEERASRAALLRLGASAESMADAPPKRQVKTFLFTDICRSTNLVEAIGDELWRELVRWHDVTLRSLFAEANGEEIDHAGDGFFVAFAEPGSAIECAVAIQRRLADHRRAHGFAPQLRIGLHATEAIRDGDGYRGRGVHEAARVAAIAAPDEILASCATLVAAGITPSERRAVELKGLEQPIEVCGVAWR